MLTALKKGVVKTVRFIGMCLYAIVLLATITFGVLIYPGY